MKAATTKAAFRVAFAALFFAALAGGVLYGAAFLLNAVEGIDEWWWASLAAAALAGGLAAALSVRHALGNRLAELAETLDGRVDQSDYLTRVPEMGDDEVGRIAASINRLLKRITTLQTDVIDQGRELEGTQRALALAEELAEKRHELETRLKERRLLFEVLRESTETHELDEVLTALVERVGPAMRLSTLAVLLKEPGGHYLVHAAWGFPEEEAVVGTTVARRGGGPWSVDRGMLLVPDLSRAPGAASFFEAIRDEGSLGVIPIAHRKSEIGLLVITRDLDDPLTEDGARLLEAIADQAALAIHNSQLVARLESLSTHDELTALPNRRLLQRRMEAAIAQADRYAQPLSLLAVDIDHFKALNDRMGHASGDAALAAVAEAMRGGLREVDTAARVGGEEFVVLLPNTDRAGAVEVAEKLRRRIAELDVEGAAGQPLGHLSISLGVALRHDGETSEPLMARADEALYAAKHAGRDRVATDVG